VVRSGQDWSGDVRRCQEMSGDVRRSGQEWSGVVRSGQCISYVFFAFFLLLPITAYYFPVCPCFFLMHFLCSVYLFPIYFLSISYLFPIFSCIYYVFSSFSMYSYDLLMYF